MFKGRARPMGRWRMAHKLSLASVLMILLVVIAGGSGLLQVLTIGRTIGEAHQKEQQLAWSLELLAAGHRLIAALDHMFAAQDPLLASTEVPASLGTLRFYMETLQQTGGESGASDLLGKMRVAYSELRQAVSKVDVLARQERWREVGVALEREVRPANERMGFLIQQLVRQTDQDVKAMTVRTQAMIQRAALLLAILTVLTTAVAWGWRHFVFQGLSLSVSELRKGVARISSGDLQYQLDIRTGDEIEELGHEFNKMASRLADAIGSLEQRVAERTRGLQTAAEVAHATTSMLDPDQLLRRVVDLVRERFNLYYVGLFLLDEEGRFAVLRAGTGEPGRQMLAQGHQLEVGGMSMIGQCVARGEARIALDVGKEAVRFDNPLLPETRSEMALPLRSRGRVIGAMTVQSVEEAAFDEADMAVLQTMADQVAVAIDNARLFAETQAAFQELEAVHRRYLGRMWAEYVRTRAISGYEQTPAGMKPLGGEVLPEVWQAIKERRMIIQSSDGDNQRGGLSQASSGLTEASSQASRAEPPGTQPLEASGQGRGVSIEPPALVAPILLGGQPVGALGLKREGQQWSAEDIALVEAITEQLALAAENLRLLDETQRRAARDRLAAEITARVRASTDVDTILRTAILELGRALRASDGLIQLHGGDGNGIPGNPQP